MKHVVSFQLLNIIYVIVTKICENLEVNLLW